MCCWKPLAAATRQLLKVSKSKYVSYRERRNLARTLQDNDDVIHTLEALIGCAMHLFAIIPYMMIFRGPISSMLFSLSSVSVAGAFVFGNSLKTVYESVVFLFVIRPYQASRSTRLPLLLRVISQPQNSTTS